MAGLAAIILAAGYSSRMGKLKALLPFGGTSLLKKQIYLFKRAGIKNVIVVCGHMAESITAEAEGLADTVFNADFDRGMFTSIQAGARALCKYDCEGFMFMPVDYALVRPYAIKLLAQEFKRDTGKLVFPAFGGKRGHPPVLPAFMAQELVNYDGDGGARKLFACYAELFGTVEMPTDECLEDMDTPEDYEKLKELYDRSIPTKAECRAMFIAEATPANVIAHCETVARTAGRIAEAVNSHGMGIDTELVYAAALLHDINRTEPLHEFAGSKTLLDNGFSRVAGIIQHHMDLGEPYLNKVCEESIVYLADKLVKNTTVMPLESRLEKVDISVRALAAEKLKAAHAIQQQVESICGKSVFDLLGI